MTDPKPKKPLIEQLVPWAVALSVLLFALDGKLLWDQAHRADAEAPPITSHV